MPLLPENRSLLLDLPVRLGNLPTVHERPSLGPHLQQHHLAMSRLRPDQRLR
jgi:hypothetical protein